MPSILDQTLTDGEIALAIFFMLAFIFMVFSTLGWVLELFFRRIFTAKKWINPGLLRGPCLPIYGLGILSLTVYVSLLSNFKESFPAPWVFDLVVILGIGILMTLLELVGGLIFIKGMNIRLWDYSKRWGNYKGVICPLFSFLWTVAGALFYYFLYHPILVMAFDFVVLDWFIMAVFLLGLYYGVFVTDLCSSLQLGSKLKHIASDNGVVLRYENLKQYIKTELKARNIHSKFISPFQSPIPLKEHVADFIKDKAEPLEKIFKKNKKSGDDKCK